MTQKLQLFKMSNPTSFARASLLRMISVTQITITLSGNEETSGLLL